MHVARVSGSCPIRMPWGMVMNNYSKGIFALCALGCIWILSDTRAYASVTCATTNGVRSGWLCSNADSGGTTIAVRHIPAWGANSGVVIVDMCPSAVGKDQSGIPVTDGTVSVRKIEKESPGAQSDSLGCLRRTCTDDVSEFAIRVSAVPIPIGFDLFLGVVIGFKNSQFEVNCKTFGAVGEVTK
jgi:hypothetical protein